jgi:hypothetical protein
MEDKICAPYDTTNRKCSMHGRDTVLTVDRSVVQELQALALMHSLNIYFKFFGYKIHPKIEKFVYKDNIENAGGSAASATGPLVIRMQSFCRIVVN